MTANDECYVQSYSIYCFLDFIKLRMHMMRNILQNIVELSFVVDSNEFVAVFDSFAGCRLWFIKMQINSALIMTYIIENW